MKKGDTPFRKPNGPVRKRHTPESKHKKGHEPDLKEGCEEDSTPARRTIPETVRLNAKFARIHHNLTWRWGRYYIFSVEKFSKLLVAILRSEPDDWGPEDGDIEWEHVIRDKDLSPQGGPQVPWWNPAVVRVLDACSAGGFDVFIDAGGKGDPEPHESFSLAAHGRTSYVGLRVVFRMRRMNTCASPSPGH